MAIDDFAKRKRQNYGTVMINKDNGKVVDVIDTRDKEEVIEWLKKYSKIKYITRDGAHSYGYAIKEALPKAIQISDRFHLFQGITEYASIELRRLMSVNIKTEILATKQIKKSKKFKEITVYEQKKIDNLEKRKTLVKKVQELYSIYENMNQVAREMGITKRLVKKYIETNVDEMKIQNNTGSSKLNQYQDFIYDHIEYPATRIYESLVEMGYDGAYSTVKNRINKIKRENNCFVIKYEIIKRTNIIKLLFNKGINDLNITKGEKEVIRKYLKSNKEVQLILDIVTKFRIMMYSQDERKLLEWIEETKSKNVREINKFINGIMNDYEAVKNCVLNLDQSNGIAEGKITKIKSIKRTMYGRCSFNFLRNKIFLLD